MSSLYFQTSALDHIEPLTFEVFASNKVVFNAEVLVLGVVHDSGFTVPLGPQNLGFPLEFNEQGVYLAVFGHLQLDLTRNAVSIGKSVLLINRVIGHFEALYGGRHDA